VKRLPAETVCDQATFLLKPMLGMPLKPVVAPIESTWPGTVTCSIQKRFTPIHGKCGLPSSMPRPLAVMSRPKAQALEPSGESSRPVSRIACAASATVVAAGAAAVAAGGCAPTTASARASTPACTIVISLRRFRSVSVIGRTQG
jgi:hypothetical protein